MQSNVEVVQALFDRYAEGGVDAAIGVMREDVVIEIPGDLSAEPDVYLGHEGVRRYFDGFTGMIDEVEYVPLELLPRGRHVIARSVLRGRGARSGLDVEIEVAVLHELEDGKIVRVHPYPDMESAEAALG